MSYVPPLGPKDAKIVLVGEAPGEQEARLGQPFVGRSGKFLTHLLAQAGILRSQCYITNVIKERPANNNISLFIDLGKKVPRVSDKAENYLRILQKEMLDVRPNVIVPLGNVGLWALTGERGITKWRGSILSDRGIKVIPTIHPSSALREYNNRYLIAHDLAKVGFHSQFPEIPEDTRQYIIRPTLEQCYEYLDRCKQSELFAFDIEVSHGEVSCISFSTSPNHAISIPFTRKGDDYFLRTQEGQLWREIGGILENPNLSKVAHNASFDCTFLYRKYGIRTVNVEDTMIAEGIIHPEFRKRLQDICSWYTTMPYYKDEGKESFKAQDNEQFWTYNAKDSIVLMEAFPKMKAELERQGNYETYRNQCDLIPVLTWMSEKGIAVDLDSLKERQKEYGTKIEELNIILKDIVGYDINPLSPKQLVEYFYEIEGYKPYLSRKTGRPTTDEKALKRLAIKGAKAASVLLEIREAEKLKGTYLDVKLGADSRLRASFNPIGTVTLRLSSSKDIFGVGTNLQNLPPKMKENLIPDPGFVAFEIDLAQAENRVVAYIAPEPKMIEAFETGQDVHSLTAGFIFRMDPAEVKELYKEWEEKGKPSDLKYCPSIGQGNKPFRYWGKEANHAFNYGLHFVSAGLRWEIPQKDAKFIYEGYHRTYPGVKMMHRWIEHELNKTRTVGNLFSFKRRFLGAWADATKQAYAFVAQSTVAEIINRRGLKYVFYNPDLFPTIQLLDQVHDSIIFQLPLSDGWESIAQTLCLIKNELETPLTFRGNRFVIPADITMLPVNLKEGEEVTSTNPQALADLHERLTRKE